MRFQIFRMLFCILLVVALFTALAASAVAEPVLTKSVEFKKPVTLPGLIVDDSVTTNSYIGEATFSSATSTTVSKTLARPGDYLFCQFEDGVTTSPGNSYTAVSTGTLTIKWDRSCSGSLWYKWIRKKR